MKEHICRQRIDRSLDIKQQQNKDINHLFLSESLQLWHHLCAVCQAQAVKYTACVTKLCSPSHWPARLGDITVIKSSRAGGRERARRGTAEWENGESKKKINTDLRRCSAKMNSFHVSSWETEKWRSEKGIRSSHCSIDCFCFSSAPEHPIYTTKGSIYPII